MPREPETQDKPVEAHDAGGTYALRDQSPAARRSLARKDQLDAGMGLPEGGEADAIEGDQAGPIEDGKA